MDESILLSAITHRRLKSIFLDFNAKIFGEAEQSCISHVFLLAIVVLEGRVLVIVVLVLGIFDPSVEKPLIDGCLGEAVIGGKFALLSLCRPSIRRHVQLPKGVPR